MNRALNGDHVIVEFIKASEVSKDNQEAADAHGGEFMVPEVTAEADDDQIISSKGPGETRPLGRILRIIKRKVTQVIGSIDRKTINEFAGEPKVSSWCRWIDGCPGCAYQPGRPWTCQTVAL